jgi:hypothetical protein
MSEQPFKEIKIYDYVKTLVNCSSVEEATYVMATRDNTCKAKVDSYFDDINYTNTTAFTGLGRKSTSLSSNFVNAFKWAVQYFKKIDPPTNTLKWSAATLDAALKPLVWDLSTSGLASINDRELGAAMTGGGSSIDFNKIIKLSKSEVSGFVPYHVNNIAGSYTEEYLSHMNSKIKNVDTQFGGFKKVTKEVIGTVEDLDRILRTDLENQLTASINKRYYKTFPATSQIGGDELKNEDVQKLWDLVKAASPEERKIFSAIGKFRIRDNESSVERDLPYGASLPSKGLLRFNLNKVQRSTGDYDWYNKVFNKSGSSSSSSSSFFTGDRQVPLLLLMFPKIDSAEQTFTEIVAFWLSDSKLNFSSLTEPANLQDIFRCDERVLKTLLKVESLGDDDDDDGEDPFHSKKEYNDKFKSSGPGLIRNGWKWDRRTNTVQKKNEKGEWVVYDPVKSPDEFRKIFNTADQCFNSFIDFENKKDCCNLVELLAQGKPDKFFEEVRKNSVQIKRLDADFSNVNPITVVKLLEGFKFPKRKTWENGRNVYKFPNYSWWLKNVIETSPELNRADVDEIKKKPNLQEVLDMSVAFVNNNLYLLNPELTQGQSSVSTDSLLDERKIKKYVPPTYPNLYEANSWNVIRSKLKRNAIGNLPLYNNLPILPTFGGQQFVLRGGSDDKRVEIVLDKTEIIPQFTSQIAEDLKLLVDSLKSNNKYLSGKEMEKLNQELEEFRESEVKLLNKVLLINKYIKVANLLNENEKQYLTENKIKKLISYYYENFKDFSEKDLELKGISSYIRSILKNDTL